MNDSLNQQIFCCIQEARLFTPAGPLQTVAGPRWRAKVTVCLTAAEFILPSDEEMPNYFTHGSSGHLGRFYLKLHKEFGTRLFLCGSDYF